MEKHAGGIAIYSRKSRFTGKGESIGNQIELCRDYVRRVFGEAYLEKIVVFEDEGFSGGNLKRPDFQNMMEGVRKGQFRAIVVYRLDRISRNICDFTNLIDELTKLGVSFVSIREQFDTSTPMGRAMMFIISVFSQLERETIAERIRDNMHELAKSGRWLGGNTPTGFESESVGTVTVDGRARKMCKLKLIPEEGEIVKAIFNIYSATDSLTATEAELLRRRYKTKNGNDFTRFAIKGILQNPVYMTADQDAYAFFSHRGVEVYSPESAFDGTCGMMAYNRTAQEKGKNTIYLPMQEWIVAVGKHPGLIPSGQWIRVWESLERNKQKQYRKPRRNEALLTGLLFCACGERMYPKLSPRINGDGDSVYTYVCRMKERSKGQRCSQRNVSGNALDRAVLAQVKLLTGDGRRLAAQLGKNRNAFADNREAYGSQLEGLRAEFGENEKKVESLLDALTVVGESTAKVRIAERIEQLSGANRELQERICELERISTCAGIGGTEFDDLRRSLAEFGWVVEAMDVTEKREAVRILIDRVVWNGSHAQIVLAGGKKTEKNVHMGAKRPDNL